MTAKRAPVTSSLSGKNAEKMSGKKPTLMAAAFQDHLIRSMALTDCLGPRKVPLGKATQRLMKKDIRPVVDTGLGYKSQARKPVQRDTEYVLDAKPPPLTLAQKLGLVSAPAQLLSEGEWQVAKDKSNQRDDSHLPCVICKEDFGLQQQVLLSCTHVFHRNCLEAFERFTGKKTCPMCRKQQYQTRVIHEGARTHRVKCATKIQALWRGYVVRCWYHKLRQSVPPKDPVLRKKFYENKLQTITDRMVKSCETNINVFLSEIDQNLEASRQIFRSFDARFQEITDQEWENIQLKAVERGETECPICLTSLHSHVVETIQGKSSNRDKAENETKKSTRVCKTQNRGSEVTGADPAAMTASLEDTAVGRVRKTVLLSCSHVFHLTCLETFEELTVGSAAHSCPVCRTSYQKNVL